MRSYKYFIVFGISSIGIFVCTFTADARNRTFEQRRRYDEMMNAQTNAQSNSKKQDPSNNSQEERYDEDRKDLNDDEQKGRNGDEKESQEKETYEATGKVISLTEKEIEVLDSTQTPKKVYRLILGEWVTIGEEVAVGSMVHVTYRSRRVYGHRWERTVVSMELVDER